MEHHKWQREWPQTWEMLYLDDGGGGGGVKCREKRERREVEKKCREMEGRGKKNKTENRR